MNGIQPQQLSSIPCSNERLDLDSTTVTAVVTLTTSVRINPPPWPAQTAPFATALLTLGRARDDVVVLTADLAKWTDVMPFAEAFPDRFFNFGMAEQNLVGVGAGMARAGAFPVIVTYGVFATRRAYDQVAMGLCTGDVSALLVGFLPGISSQFKATHQAIDDVALMRALPGMTVLDPLDATELGGLTLAAADSGRPVLSQGFPRRGADRAARRTCLSV